LGHEGEEITPDVARRQTHHQATGALHRQAGDAEQAQPDRAHLGLLQCRADQGRPTDVFDQRVGRGRQQHPERVRQEAVATRPVGEEPELLLFDAVLAVTPLTVHVLVQGPRVAGQVRHHVTRIRLALPDAPQMLGFHDHPPRAFLRRRRVTQRAEDPVAAAVQSVGLDTCAIHSAVNDAPNTNERKRGCIASFQVLPRSVGGVSPDSFGPEEYGCAGWDLAQLVMKIWPKCYEQGAVHYPA